MRRTLAVVVALVAMASGACGDDDGDGDTAAPTTTTGASSAPTTTDGGSSSSDYELPFETIDALLDDDDMEPFGLVSGGDLDPEENAQAICGEGTPADIAGYDGGGLNFSDESGNLNLDETIWGWADESAAEQAFDLSRRDVSCGTGSFEAGEGGPQVEFDFEETDLGEQFGDASFAVAGTASVASSSVNVILAQVRVDNYLLQLSFSAPPGTTDAPDAREIVRLATEKLEAAAGA
jgi:hypothetical protein